MSMPEFLHKYRSLDPDGLARVRQSLITKSLWLSRPSSFNDPFDCAPVVKTTWDRAGVNLTARRAADQRTRQSARWEKRKERRTVARFMQRHRVHWQDQAQAIAVETINDIRNATGVLSLAEDPASVLMWSHYAHSHTGLIMTFRTDNGDLISEAQRVQYSENRPVVDVVADRENAMVATLLRKADYWSYEREWRTVRVGKPGLHNFAPASLEAIIFGAFTRDEHKETIKQAAQVGGLTPRYERAVFDPDKFQLDIIPE